MIIPLIDASHFNASRLDSIGAQVSNAARRSLIQTIQHWSLFGKVAISNLSGFNQAELEQIALAVGGAVELQVSRESRDATSLLGLLNAGASSIYDLPESEKPSELIPEQAWTALSPHDQAEFTKGQQVYLNRPTSERLAQLEEWGVDVLVDAERLEREPILIADFLRSVLKSDRQDGLWPTVIVDELGFALGLAYSNYESLLDAITHRRGTYWSRSRNELWVKGAASGNTQQLLGVRLDCDCDTLRFQVAQHNAGFCHLGSYACFGEERTLVSVIARLRERCESGDGQSFTKKLVNQPELLRVKLLEEAQELADAKSPVDVAFEAADVLYFTMVKMLSSGVELNEVCQELARRMTRVIRRENKLESG